MVQQIDLKETMSAVAWLALRYHHRQGYLSQDDIEEAKSMEKLQIKKAYNDAAGDMIEHKYEGMDNYYNRNYGSNNQI